MVDFSHWIDSGLQFILGSAIFLFIYALVTLYWDIYKYKVIMKRIDGLETQLKIISAQIATIQKTYQR